MMCVCDGVLGDRLTMYAFVVYLNGSRTYSGEDHGVWSASSPGTCVQRVHSDGTGGGEEGLFDDSGGAWSGSDMWHVSSLWF